MPDPFPKPCPNCGHAFTLAELKMMAVGDGYRRFIFIEGADGKPDAVDFNDFNPDTMTPIETQYGDGFNRANIAHQKFERSVDAVSAALDRRKKLGA